MLYLYNTWQDSESCENTLYCHSVFCIAYTLFLILRKSLNQGCSTLDFRVHFFAEISSNPNQTQTNQGLQDYYKVAGVFIKVGVNLRRKVDLHNWSRIEDLCSKQFCKTVSLCLCSNLNDYE